MEVVRAVGADVGETTLATVSLRGVKPRACAWTTSAIGRLHTCSMGKVEVYDSKSTSQHGGHGDPEGFNPARPQAPHLSTGSTLHKRREQQVPTANMDQDWNQGAPHPHACHYSPS